MQEEKNKTAWRWILIPGTISKAVRGFFLLRLVVSYHIKNFLHPSHYRYISHSLIIVSISTTSPFPLIYPSSPYQAHIIPSYLIPIPIPSKIFQNLNATNPALSGSTTPQTFPPPGAVNAPLIIIVTTLPTTLSRLPGFPATLGCNPPLSTNPSNQPQISLCCFCGVYSPCPPMPIPPLPAAICLNVQGDHAITGVLLTSETAGMTRVGQPLSRCTRS